MTTTPPAAPTSLPKPRRRWWVTLLLSLVIFAAGAVVGAGLTVAVAVKRIQHAIMHPEEAPRHITDHLRSKLDLTDEQASAVLLIVTKRQAALQAIRAEVHPRVETELEGAFADVDKLLTPKQSAAWRTMVKRLRDNWMPPLYVPGAVAAPK